MRALAVLFLLGFDPAVDLSTQIGSKSIRDWIGTLSAGDPVSRRTAAEVLGYLGPDARPAIPALIRASSDPDAAVRKSAIDALGSIGPEAREAVPGLIRAVSDPDISVRTSAIGALGSIGPESREVIPALARACLDEDDNISLASIYALARIGDPAVPSLIPAMESLEPEKRYDAVFLLGRMGPKAAKAVAALIRKYRAIKPTRLLATIDFKSSRTLGQIGPAAREAESLIAEALKTDFGDHAMAEQATRALARLGVPPVSFLSEILILTHDKYQRKVHALDLLESLGSGARAVVPMLQRMTRERRNDDLWARAAAASSRIDPTLESCIPVLTEAMKDHEGVALLALKRLGPRARSALRAIRDALSRSLDGDGGGEQSAAPSGITRVLVWIDPDGREIVPSLLMALRKGDLEVQAYAADGLGLVGRDSPEAVTARAQTLESATDEEPDPFEVYDMAECAALALARIGEKAAPAVPLLIDALGSRREGKRKAAAIALAGIGPAAKRATAALIRTMNDRSIEVRYRALTALGCIGPEREAVHPLLVASWQNGGSDLGAYAFWMNAALALVAIDPSIGRDVLEKLMAGSKPRDFSGRALLSNAIGVSSFESERYLRNAVRAS